MDVYASMSSFEAHVRVRNLGPGGERKVSFAWPHQLRVDSLWDNGYSMTAVCDGVRLVEYTNREDQVPTSYPAPHRVWTASSRLMSHSMFCGSLLYRFFAGGANLEKLANLNHSYADFGGEEDLDGETAVVVRFFGLGSFGNVRALIGTNSGLVHRIEYDSAPLVRIAYPPEVYKIQRTLFESKIKEAPEGPMREMWEQMRNMLPIPEEMEPDEIPLPEPVWSMERYLDIKVNGGIAPNVFETAVPDGIEAVETGAEVPPSLKVGQPAPEFSIKALAGEPVALSDLCGQVVLIYVWASWSARSKKRLHRIAQLAEQAAAGGFCVLAVSDESVDTIGEYIRSEGLAKLPVYADSFGDIWWRYRVEAVPTTIIINAQSELFACMTGLQQIGAIKANLRMAGAIVP